MHTDQAPRTFEEIAQHADIVREECNVAQGSCYITGTNPDRPDPTYPKLPGFRNDRLVHGAGALDATARREPEVRFMPPVHDHIRFLEQAVERLAAQVSELAQRLAEKS